MIPSRDALFDRYAQLLLKWNRTHNLTAITDERAIRTHHFDDSRAPLPYVKQAHSLLDLGTGAGFPGIPLKIEAPHLRTVVVDATRKKVAFCKEVIRSLGLEDIRAVQGRAEDRSLVEELGQFDIVISRATWALEQFLRMADPYYNDTGACIAMRGSKWQQELSDARPALDELGLVLADTHAYTVGNEEQRCLLIIKRRT